MRVYVEGSQGSLWSEEAKMYVCWHCMVCGRRFASSLGLIIFVAAKFEDDGLTDGQEILASFGSAF